MMEPMSSRGFSPQWNNFLAKAEIEIEEIIAHYLKIVAIELFLAFPRGSLPQGTPTNLMPIQST